VCETSEAKDDIGKLRVKCSLIGATQVGGGWGQTAKSVTCACSEGTGRQCDPVWNIELRGSGRKLIRGVDSVEPLP